MVNDPKVAVMIKAVKDGIGFNEQFESLRRLVQESLNGGTTVEALLQELEIVREAFPGDDEDEAILQVMDSLVGWCHPSKHLVAQNLPV